MSNRLTIQVPRETYTRLRRLTRERHETMADTVAWLIDRAEERRFWEAFNAGYAALRSDLVAWREEQRERASWDTSLSDEPFHA